MPVDQLRESVKELTDGYNALVDALRKLQEDVRSSRSVEATNPAELGEFGRYRDLHGDDGLPDKIVLSSDWVPDAPAPPITPMQRRHEDPSILLPSTNDMTSSDVRVVAFTAHYAGYEEETAAFKSIPGCLNSQLTVCLDVRACGDNGGEAADNHPGNQETRISGGMALQGWGNAIATWSGDDSNWIDLAYCYILADGTDGGHGTSAHSGFYIDGRCTTAGVFELRVRNDLDDDDAGAGGDGVFNACVIAVAVWIIPTGATPGTIECGVGGWKGGGGSHEGLALDNTGTAQWGDGKWTPNDLSGDL